MNKTPIQNITVKPKCTQCNNTEDFIAYGYAPYLYEFHGSTISIQEVKDDNDHNKTYRATVETVRRILCDRDYAIPILCKHCNSSEIDLVPIEMNEGSSQIDFDREYIGNRNY